MFSSFQLVIDDRVKLVHDIFPDVMLARPCVRIIPIKDLFAPCFALVVYLLTDLLLQEVGKVSGSAELPDIELEHLRDNLDA